MVGCCLLAAVSCTDPLEENLPPAASFSYSPESPSPGDTVTLDASQSSDSDGHIVAFLWTFGDGKTGEAVTVNHIYESDAAYRVTLIVTDDGGDSDTTSSTVTVEYALNPVADYDLDIKSPSGLSFSVDGNHLWTVSDKPGGAVFKISLTGEIVRRLSYTGADMEGVVQSILDSTLWVVEELTGEVVQIDTVGNELGRVTLSGVTGGGGLEGITINPEDGHSYLLKEKDPGALIELNATLEFVSYDRITFAADYSGISYDAVSGQLWILSDEEEKVYRVGTDGEVVRKYRTEVIKGEGIAVDEESGLIYIISDESERLYQFSVER